jgi:hypothetical protein
MECERAKISKFNASFDLTGLADNVLRLHACLLD